MTAVELTPEQRVCPHPYMTADRCWVCSLCKARVPFRPSTPVFDTPPRPPYLYVASSWRNRHYPLVVEIVRGVGAAEGRPEPDYGVYDFRAAGGGGFSWREVDEGWESWDLEAYRRALTHPAAERGWALDKGALDRATACLLVGPCGRSAHLELGYIAGRGLPTAIYLPEKQEPELMYRLADRIILDPVELMAWTTEQMRLAA